MRLFLLFLISSVSFAQSGIPYRWVTVGSDTLDTLSKSRTGARLYAKGKRASIVRVRADKVLNLSYTMHNKFNRCAGFMAHATLEEAKEAARMTPEKMFAERGKFVRYSISEPEVMKPMVKQVKEPTIRAMIEKLMSFHNRYYKAQTGVKSQAFLKAFWEKLVERRTDAKVEFFKHEKWPQPSVVLTIEGSTNPDEVVVIGGHADSINSSGWGNRAGARAPGADDNASGIATITEVIRVLVNNNYKPGRTLKFMGYAAEEVGLLGSAEIAKFHKTEGIEVVGVVQLDMTNHKGTQDKDIVMMSDFTKPCSERVYWEAYRYIS
jgi:leucyl aminopeptidase